MIIQTGYQWQVDRSQDEVYLAAQESSGQHRDAQGEFNQTILCFSINDWRQTIQFHTRNNFFELKMNFICI